MPRSCHASATTNAISALCSFIRTYMAWATTTGGSPVTATRPNRPRSPRRATTGRPPRSDSQRTEIRSSQRTTPQETPAPPRDPARTGPREPSYHRARQCPPPGRTDTSSRSPETHHDHPLSIASGETTSAVATDRNRGGSRRRWTWRGCAYVLPPRRRTSRTDTLRLQALRRRSYPERSRSRSSDRRILPLIVFGSSSTKWISRGYL